MESKNYVLYPLKEQSVVCLDTSVLMEDNICEFTNHLESYLRHTGHQCVIIDEVQRELIRHYHGNIPEKRIKAERALQVLHRLFRAGLLVVLEPAPAGITHADAAWISLLSQHRIRHDITMLTNDRGLARDITNLNSLESSVGRPIDVFYVNRKTARLGRFHFEYDENHRVVDVRSVSSHKDLLAAPADAPLSGQKEYMDGDVLTGQKGAKHYTLKDELAFGREGSVWCAEEEPSQALKLFSQPTQNKLAKVGLLMDTKAVIPGAVLPRDILLNGQGEFCGYAMDRIDGIPLDALFTSGGQQRHAPHWDRRDYAQLALSLVRLCNHLGNAGILPGDIKGGNFLVGRDGHGQLNADILYAIDLDSAQLADESVFYPSEGVTPNYCAPEYLRDGFPADGLRTEASFRFSVTLLAAQIIFCGIHPFRVCSENEDSSVLKAIEDGIFPFGVACSGRAGVSPSGAEKLWSNLPLRTKQLIHAILHRDGALHDPEHRPSLRKLEETLKDYLDWLDNRENLLRYPEIRSVSPRSMKPYFAICANPRCGKEFIVDRFRKDNRYFCPDCLDRYRRAVASQKQCAQCGSSFAVYNFEKKVPPDCCPRCRGETVPTEPQRPSSRQPQSPIGQNHPWFNGY